MLKNSKAKQQLFNYLRTDNRLLQKKNPQIHITTPVMAGFMIDIPASPLKTILKMTFNTAAPITIPISHFQLLCHVR
jgi:hypothetical protein